MIAAPRPAARWTDLVGPPPQGVAEALLGEPHAAAKLTPLGAGRAGLELHRAELASGEVLFVKRFAAPRARRPDLVRRLTLAAARREWRALRRLATAGAPVPAPRGAAALRDGSLALVTRWIDGPRLPEVLASGVGAAELAREVGAAVARLHRAGRVHGRLDARRVRLTATGPAILGVRALRRARRGGRLADVAELDRSLRGRLRLVDRVRLRATALGLRGPPFSAAARLALRDVARRARAAGLAHARRCMRRSLAPGPGIARVGFAALAGLRAHALSEPALAAALAAPPPASGARRRVRWTCASGRRVVVKEFAGGLAGALVARLRGSPARRAWRAGHGLAALGVGAAVPLAFLEQRRLGLVFRSLLVLEDLAPAPAADAPAPGLGAEERVDALVRLAQALHGAGVEHRDFLACNALLVREGRVLAARLVDLEDVRLPRRLGDAARLRGLAQLNASLPDWIPVALRPRAFDRYARWLPFRSRAARARARIAALGVARRHHWSGCRP